MIRATRVLPAGKWSSAAADTVTLDYDQRHRRRHAMTGASGTDFLLDLADAIPLRHGDALQLENGSLVLVKAASEPLAEITAAGGPNHLLRVAWHLGNRHLPTEALADRLRIRRDHVIEEMVQGLDATVTHVVAPFNPEGGAYAHPAVHHHHHHGDAPSLAHDDRLDEGTTRRG